MQNEIKEKMIEKIARCIWQLYPENIYDTFEKEINSNGGTWYFEQARIILNIIEENQWQPIKTAPKDGTHILVYADAKSAPFKGHFCGITSVHWYCDRWCMGKTKEDYLELAIQPTHWQPLPKPPGE